MEALPTLSLLWAACSSASACCRRCWSALSRCCRLCRRPFSACSVSVSFSRSATVCVSASRACADSSKSATGFWHYM